MRLPWRHYEQILALRQTACIITHKMNKPLTFIITMALAANTTILYAQKTPEWITQRPRSDQYFYGRGEGPTAEAAEESAHQEILVQLSSQVRCGSQNANCQCRKVNVKEKVEAFIGSTRLRTAELEDSWKKGRRYWALVRYPEDCGLALAKSTSVFYAKELDIDPQAVLEALDEGAMIRGARIEQIIKDSTENNYGGDIPRCSAIEQSVFRY